MNLRSLTCLILLAGAMPAFSEPAPSLGDLRKVGDVNLPISCDEAVRPDFNRAVALLHSFFYDEARRRFTDIATRDPKCAMAQWGIAMTLWHPIWTPPSPEEMEAGSKAAEQAKALGGKTDVERRYIAAIGSFYAAPDAAKPGAGGQSCHGPTGGAHAPRAAAYEAAMADFFADRPDDVEVAAFYTLSLLGTASPTDKTLANQTKATTILERFYAKHPDHPGVVHYLIHGYDYPSVAAKGLPAAQSYAKIAPWVPHVLHMPSHIFTRLGMWKEVVDSNLASADAATQYAARQHPGAASFEELHALDYMVYGHLQTADDEKAQKAVARLRAIDKTYPEIDFVVAYAAGAIPARYALERRQWKDAAALTIEKTPLFARFPFAEGSLVFAQGLGAARTGQKAEARAALTRLSELVANIKDPRHQYFARQTEMQAKILRGWIAAAEKQLVDAERILREAADEDDLLGKHPVSPGSILPARELLADFLLEQGRFDAALTEYAACLKVNPRRLVSLHGAGQAAEFAGKLDEASRYYAELADMAAPDAVRPEVKHARAFLVADADKSARR
jgi:tetratricopeptide (TPR) repeat protein